MTLMLIYLIRNSRNGRWYVGKTVKPMKERWRLHIVSADSEIRRRMQPVHYAIRKYGPDAFATTVLLDGIESENELNVAEVFCIALFRRLDPALGYNASEGGDGGGKLKGVATGPWSEAALTRLQNRKRIFATAKKVSFLKESIREAKEYRERTGWIADGRPDGLAALEAQLALMLRTKLEQHQAKMRKRNRARVVHGEHGNCQQLPAGISS